MECVKERISGYCNDWIKEKQMLVAQDIVETFPAIICDCFFLDSNAFNSSLCHTLIVIGHQGGKRKEVRIMLKYTHTKRVSLFLWPKQRLCFQPCWAFFQDKSFWGRKGKKI